MPRLRGENEVTGDKIIDEIQIRDRGGETRYSTFELDELAADHFQNQLTQLDTISPQLAEDFIDRYTNLRTCSWAISHDQNQIKYWGFDPEHLFKAFGEHGIYINEDSRDAGILKPPEDLLDDESECENGVSENEDSTTQSGLSDF